MGIKAKFTPADISRTMANALQRIDNAVMVYLSRLGEMCLIESRTNKTYHDQTGNLTASMGYVIVANGRVRDKGGFTGAYGGSVGHAFALSKAIQHPTGYALIVVAGMNYAYTVETRGYNVLASAELLAEKELPRMMAQLNRNIGKMKL